uniref:Uncharacterized protein n=1 Tax=viral metagenome TaxID=1070528 RepID=A0A6C0CZ76_9ZZZZ
MGSDQSRTGCDKACETPLSKVLDKHVNRTSNSFFVNNDRDLTIKEKNVQDITISCPDDSEFKNSDRYIESDKIWAPVAAQIGVAGGKYNECRTPAFCDDVNITANIDSSQKVQMTDLTEYSPEAAASDNTNIASVVSNSTQFLDQSTFGNSEGIKNLQQMSNIDLEGQNINEQNASIINKILMDTSIDNEQKVELKTDSIGVLHKINDSCAPPAKINLNTVSNQNIRLMTSAGSKAAMESINSIGVTTDTDNKADVEHHNVDTNAIVDRVGDTVDNTVNTIGSVANNVVDTGRTWIYGVVAIIICIVVAVIFFFRRRSGNTQVVESDENPAYGTRGTPGLAGGGKILNCMNSFKLTDEQLIMSVIIILLSYNIYR